MSEAMPFNELFKEARNDLRQLYLDESDKRPWAVAWSGGKDSTCVMGLVVSMLESLSLEERWREIHAVMSDTQMENPNLEEYMHDQVDKLNDYAKIHKLPIDASVVIRPPEHSYFYLVLGKGYFLPQNNGAGRWCTQRLKIMPQDKKLKEIDPSYILLGVRSSESSKRKKSIEKWSGMNDLSYKIGEHVSLKTAKTFMPIVDFDIEDVWTYLQRERLGWSSTHMVRKLYKEATGECGFTNPKQTEKKASTLEACGARFGCWNCPVILKDKSTEEMSKYNNWMEPLSEWRTLQIKVFGDYKPNKPQRQKRAERSKILRQWEEIDKQIKFISKSGHKMNKPVRMIDKQGNIRDDQGTLTIEARKYLLDALLDTQVKVNVLRSQSGLKPLQLISDEEVDMIRERWKEDELVRPWLITNVRKIPIERMDELIKLGDEIERNQSVNE